MNNVAVGFLTKDRVELSKQSIVPLLQPDRFDTHWFDGSNTEAGEQLPYYYPQVKVHSNVRGGADPAVVYALTTLVDLGYEYIGLCENDVLLHGDWFGPTMALFSRGEDMGLNVGAASARCFKDRILIQCNGFAVMHNLGWGMVILSREAALLTLHNMRTRWTSDNRRTFARLTTKDIGAWWAFRGQEHFLTPDWGNDAMLAEHGLASLALVPSPVEMIGQVPPLAEQGLEIAAEPFDLLRDDAALKLYTESLSRIQKGEWVVRAMPPFHRDEIGTTLVFAHQLPMIGGVYNGDWELKWAPGFGGFAWRAGERSWFTIDASGPCEFLVSGGEKGARVRVTDAHSGYDNSPTLQPEGAQASVMQLACPCAVSYRTLTLAAEPGAVFYGMRFREPPPWLPDATFDYSMLPGVEHG